ncbi:MAG: ADP-ribosylglycohydrolase family protein [Caulobacter sp.]|nr:ADP-ribosylglycohydrolase family protein [Caulobacter sp.]
MMSARPNLERAIVNSALWAAAGDAVGWITELVDGAGVRRRIGADRIREVVAWDRMIGGRNGVNVRLPAGTYSDDTQLRLSVSRSIRGNGVFDPEAFAKIELTVWQNYALGAGRGSKAAATNLSRSDTNWFSNFFRVKDLDYMAGGGNGAAMRVQPHAWAMRGEIEGLILDVARNSLVTHGAMHGLVGALLHALALNYAIASGEVPQIRQLHEFLSAIEALPEILGEDRQLSAFWLPAWENEARGSLAEALSAHLTEIHADIDRIQPLVRVGDFSRYGEIIEAIGAFEPNLRGSGSKTALASCALAIIASEAGPEAAVIESANTLMSDTDTIGTMVGAILGATRDEQPTWEIQDREYIIREAKRLAEIRHGATTDGFAYPDVTTWMPPQTQADAVGVVDRAHLALAGLGELTPVGTEYQTKDAIWQWMALPFGQTILAKRRPNPKRLNANLLPRGRVNHAPPSAPNAGPAVTSASQEQRQPRLPLNTEPLRSVVEAPSQNAPPRQRDARRPFTLDDLADEVIRSNFDPVILGRNFNRVIFTYESTDMAVAFSSIIAKAQITRLRKAK